MGFLKRLLGFQRGPTAGMPKQPPVTRPSPEVPTSPSSRSEATAEEPTEIGRMVEKLTEYGFRGDILDPEPYFEAVDRLGQIGEAAIPALIRHLGEGKLIAAALGRIGGRSAIEALARELSSSDWRRVEAAARGLGVTGDPSAKPHIERAMGSEFDRSVAEVHQALVWAMSELYGASSEPGRVVVDRNNIWQQIQAIKTDFEDSPKGKSQREEAIQLCQAIVKELPNLTVRVPGYS